MGKYFISFCNHLHCTNFTILETISGFNDFILISRYTIHTKYQRSNTRIRAALITPLLCAQGFDTESTVIKYTNRMPYVWINQLQFDIHTHELYN